MQGVDLVTVREFLGHKTINMANRYADLAVAKANAGQHGARQNQTETVSADVKKAINAV